MGTKVPTLHYFFVRLHRQPGDVFYIYLRCTWRIIIVVAIAAAVSIWWLVKAMRNVESTTRLCIIPLIHPWNSCWRCRTWCRRCATRDSFKYSSLPLLHVLCGVCVIKDTNSHVWRERPCCCGSFERLDGLRCYLPIIEHTNVLRLINPLTTCPLHNARIGSFYVTMVIKNMSLQIVFHLLVVIEVGLHILIGQHFLCGIHATLTLLLECRKCCSCSDAITFTNCIPELLLEVLIGCFDFLTIIVY